MYIKQFLRECDNTLESSGIKLSYDYSHLKKYSRLQYQFIIEMTMFQVAISI